MKQEHGEGREPAEAVEGWIVLFEHFGLCYFAAVAVVTERPRRVLVAGAARTSGKKGVGGAPSRHPRLRARPRVGGVRVRHEGKPPPRWRKISRPCPFVPSERGGHWTRVARADASPPFSSRILRNFSQSPALLPNQ